MAVGAPSDGEGAGAVYIYRGGAGGLAPTPSQVILAADVHSAFRGFGGALAAGVDVDNDGYSGNGGMNNDVSMIMMCQ